MCMYIYIYIYIEILRVETSPGALPACWGISPLEKHPDRVAPIHKQVPIYIYIYICMCYI